MSRPVANPYQVGQPLRSTMNARDDEVLDYVDAVASPSTTRRAMTTISTPAASSSISYLTNAEMTARFALQIAVTSTRWRLRIRNYSLQNEINITGGGNFVQSYLGVQAFDVNGVATAGLDGPPELGPAPFTLATDGTEYVSEWITDPDAQIRSNVRHMLSLAYTGGTGTQSCGGGEMWYANLTGDASRVAQEATTGFGSTQRTVFDIRLEFEWVGNEKVILVAPGDSTSGGGGNITVPASSRWPEVYGRRNGYVIINGGCPSTRLVEWASDTHWKHLRFNPAEVTVDAAIVFCGINDIAQAATLVQAQSRLKTAVDALKSVWGEIPVAVMLLMPYTAANTSSVLVNPVAASATTIVTAETFAASTSIRVGVGTLADARTVSGTPTVNGDGTYTVTLSSGLTRAHERGEPVIGSVELVREDFNAYLRALPLGFVAVGDAGAAVAAPYNPRKWHGQLTTDNLHPNAQGHPLIAREAPRFS